MTRTRAMPRRPSHAAYARLVTSYVRQLGRWAAGVLRSARADEDGDVTAETDLEAIRQAAELVYLARRAMQRASLRAANDGGPPVPPAQRQFERVLTPAARVALTSSRKAIVDAGADPRLLDARIGVATTGDGVPVIDIAPTAVELRQIESFARDGVDLITRVQQAYLEGLDKRIAASVRAGLRYTQLAELVQVQTGISERHATLIARDQIGKLNGRIVQDTQTAAGVQSYVWRTARDQRVRGNPAGPYARSTQDHWGLRGTEHRWDNPPERAGPYGQPAHPGESIQCRCFAEPMVPEDLRRRSVPPPRQMRQMGPRGLPQDPGAPMVDVSGRTFRDALGRPLAP